MKMFITLIGLVLILEGLPYVASPEAKQHWLKQITELPAATLRLFGIFAMAAGFALCFFSLKSGLFG